CACPIKKRQLHADFVAALKRHSRLGFRSIAELEHIDEPCSLRKSQRRCEALHIVLRGLHVEPIRECPLFDVSSIANIRRKLGESIRQRNLHSRLIQTQDPSKLFPLGYRSLARTGDLRDGVAVETLL